MPVQGPSAAAQATDHITMHCKQYNLFVLGSVSDNSFADKYDDSTGNYTQTVSLNGNTVSTLSTSDAHAQGWGSAIECAANDCGTMPAHSKCHAECLGIWNKTDIV
jgi:hypothetical protein